MNLDVLTLLLILGTGCILIGTALLVIWLQKRSEYGLFWWSMSLFMRSVTFALMLLRDRIPDWASIDLALALLVLGTGVSWAAARLQSRRTVSIAVVLGPAALLLLALQVPEIRQSMSNRLAFASVEIGFLALAVAWEFRRQARFHGRLRTGLAAIFAISGIVHLARAVYALVHPLPERLPEIGNLMAGSLYFYLLVLFLGGMIGIGFHWEQLVRSLKYEADCDVLTKANNRRAFAARAEGVLAAGSRTGKPATLLLFDLDHFKSVNDRFGHPGGDAALQAFSNLVQSQLRNVDLFGRIGGEEFAALLPDLSSEDAYRVAERLRQAVSQLEITYPKGPISLTVSIGVATSGETIATLDDLMLQADASLYEAKLRGRDRVHGPDIGRVAALMRYPDEGHPRELLTG
ncbi:GGDEF domain-containing protein [Roseibium sp. M-1]